MEKLKKIWLWISGGIVAFFGLFLLIFKVLIPNIKDRQDFKKKNRELEKEKKDVQKQIDKVVEQKALTKKEIEDLEKKINDTSGKVSDKERDDAVKILKDFKNKYK